jgi:hypothetical protein
MAAAVSHPNRVYVFEAAEIAGLPVLAIELVDGETLAQYVERVGPLEPRHAVDIALQIIDGLAAADRAGMLHRDIKPSNCFFDAHGVVKVGDFGLAIAALGSAVVSFGCTPEFSPPEQVSGGALDVRTDIYAVGATLFFLLTGRPPFEEAELTQLLSHVISEPVSWPATAETPAGLRAVITRCLAKHPTGRFTGYRELREALLPYSSLAAEPATLASSLTAAAFDLALTTPLLGPVIGGLIALRIIHSLSSILAVASLALAVYATTAIALTGTTFGMRRSGMSVVTAVGDRPGWWRSAGIGAAWLVPTLLLFGARLITSDSSMSWAVAGSVVLLIAATARLTARTDSFTKWLLQRRPSTRIVKIRPDSERHETRPNPVPVPTPKPGMSKKGPFEITRELALWPDGALLEAWDPQLHRRVWVHVRLAEAAPHADTAHSAARPTRLRWLQRSRSVDESWDAYDAPDGAPLLSQVSAVWPEVATWLADVTEETVLAEAEHRHLDLGPDRIWITARHRAVVLDFPAPPPVTASANQRAEESRQAQPPVQTAPASQTTQQRIAWLGRLALGHRDVPLPPPAARWLDRMSRNEFQNLAEAATTVDHLRTTPDRVTTRMRATSLLMSVLTLIVTNSVVTAMLRVADLSSIMPANGRALSVALLCVVSASLSALLSGGGVWLRTAGITIVSDSGAPVSPMTTVIRAALSWSWLAPLALTTGGSLPRAIPILVLAAVWHAALNPTAGIVDRLLGTRLVPR